MFLSSQLPYDLSFLYFNRHPDQGAQPLKVIVVKFVRWSIQIVFAIVVKKQPELIAEISMIQTTDAIQLWHPISLKTTCIAFPKRIGKLSKSNDITFFQSLTENFITDLSLNVT